ALARALAIGPRVLLLDEPFGALDAKVRKELRRWLRQLHDDLGTTTIFVTHDQEEALELADRVVVMSNGRIEQIGRPDDVYANPTNEFVLRFLGDVNEIPCRIRAGRIVLPGVSISHAELAVRQDGPATLYVRPQDVAIAQDVGGQATVRFVSVAGPVARGELELPGTGQSIEALMQHDALLRRPLAPGERVSVRFNKTRVFPRKSAGAKALEPADELHTEPALAIKKIA